MRILLAIDGSRSADRARDAVASLPWPDGSHVRVVAALPEHAALIGTPWLSAEPQPPTAYEHQLLYTLETSLDGAVRDLARPGVDVERVLLRGRAASTILEEARSFRPDLIVVGSRGHGRFETMLLGSVSAEVVDHAPCPVLVVRDAPLERVLFADDGSTSVGPARAILHSWPVLRHLPVTVLTVAETEIPTAGMAAGLYDEVIESYSQSIDEAIAQCSANAERTAEELGRAGYATSAVVRDGDAAHEIVALARERGIGLIVMGTRGHTGLTRLVLGSVARNVLLHAPCSVLIVPEHVKPLPTAEAVATVGAPA